MLVGMTTPARVVGRLYSKNTKCIWCAIFKLKSEKMMNGTKEIIYVWSWNGQDRTKKSQDDCYFCDVDLIGYNFKNKKVIIS